MIKVALVIGLQNNNNNLNSLNPIQTPHHRLFHRLMLPLETAPPLDGVSHSQHSPTPQQPPSSSSSSSSSSGRRQKKTSRSSSSSSQHHHQHQRQLQTDSDNILSDPQYRAMLLLRELEEEASALKLLHCKIADQVHRLQIEESVLQRQLHNMVHTGHGNLSEVGQWLNSLIATSTSTARGGDMHTEPTHDDDADADAGAGAAAAAGGVGGWNMGDAQLPHSAISDQYDQYQSSSLYGTYAALPQPTMMVKLEDDDDATDDTDGGGYVSGLMAPGSRGIGVGIGGQYHDHQQLEYAEGVDGDGRYGASSSLGSMVGTQSLMQQLMSMQHGEHRQQHQQRVQHPWLTQQQEMGGDDGLSYREPLSFSRLLGMEPPVPASGTVATAAETAVETSGAAAMDSRQEGENMADTDNAGGVDMGDTGNDDDDDESERHMRDILARHRASLGQHDTQVEATQQSEQGPD